MDKTYYVASTWKRLWAQIIDQILIGFLYLPFYKVIVALLFTEEDVFVPLSTVILIFLIPAFYEGVFLAWMGTSPGKWMMGLKVVPNHDPETHLRWDQCLLRPLTSRLSFFFSLAIYALAFFRYDRTHLADWVAETRVVQFQPRPHQPKIRWILGSFFIIIYVYEGLSSSMTFLNGVDWKNSRVEVREFLKNNGSMDMDDRDSDDE